MRSAAATWRAAPSGPTATAPALILVPPISTPTSAGWRPPMARQERSAPGRDGRQRGQVLAELEGHPVAAGGGPVLGRQLVHAHDAAAASQPREGEGAPLGFRDGDRGYHLRIRRKRPRLVRLEVDARQADVPDGVLAGWLIIRGAEEHGSLDRHPPPAAPLLST